MPTINGSGVGGGAMPTAEKEVLASADAMAAIAVHHMAATIAAQRHSMYMVDAYFRNCYNTLWNYYPLQHHPLALPRSPPHHHHQQQQQLKEDHHKRRGMKRRKNSSSPGPGPQASFMSSTSIEHQYQRSSIQGATLFRPHCDLTSSAKRGQKRRATAGGGHHSGENKRSRTAVSHGGGGGLFRGHNRSPNVKFAVGNQSADGNDLVRDSCCHADERSQVSADSEGSTTNIGHVFPELLSMIFEQLDVTSRGRAAQVRGFSHRQTDRPADRQTDRTTEG